ncbi:MAG: TonB-dependent receptor [candidate division KSB1 bacterium]|nr:TonB-dependent receptor [candidate division KSB1 bacterium]MDZ7301764.1 TonB-dependent receptor [candidate division KSB1 bacterium]MDZ7311457.1 TonB-dependent receptor [candidate division KSB1 bacterium]
MSSSSVPKLHVTARRLLRAGLFLLLYGCAIFPLQGQTIEITGQVRDAISLLPIPGVNISVVATHKGTAGDQTGNFRLHLDPGIYLLRFQHIGYFPAEITVQVPPAPRLEIALKPRILVIPGVMIESTRLNKDSLATNFVLTPRSLANAPALGEADPFRAVTLLPGVATANDLKGELHVRGGSADENLIILDGMEIQNPFHLLGLFGTFNVEALQEVRFYPGLSPVMYGDRLSSALILRSKSAEEGARSKANVSLLASSILLQRKWNHGGVMTAVRRTYLDLVARALGSRLGYYFYDSNLHLTQNLSPAWQLAVVGFFNTDHLNPEQTEGEISNDPDQDKRYRWGNRAAALSLTHTTKKTIWQNQLSFAKNYVRFAGADANLHIDNQVSDLSWRSQMEWQQEGLAAIAGIFGRHFTFHYAWQSEENEDGLEDIFYQGIPHAFHDTRRQSLFGGFFELSQTINSRLAVRAGTRISTMAFDNLQLLPRLSAQIQIPWNTSLRINYGENVQWQAFGREGIEGAVGSPLFPLHRALRARIWSLAIEQDLPGHISLSAEAYHKKFLSVSRLGEGDYPSFEFGGGKARGVDLFVLRERGRLTFQAGYSWSESIYTFGQEIYPTDWDIRHQFKGLFGFSFGKSMSLHIAAQAHSGAPYTPVSGYVPIIRDFGQGWQLCWVPLPGQRNSDRLPKYMRADISLRKRWTRTNGNTELYFQVLNLLFRRNILRYNPKIRSIPSASGSTRQYLYLETTTGLPLLPSIGIAFEF